ncbi:autotransporter domain-containing protein [Oceanicoccus sagamiensis]|uniref:Autotransporter domain-containing protein n=1 Tax=Oceanicoccus sagamiensis TaxID=716816 RepID=A0A1X9N993_9GAMM|nr:autotransporter domain-containing protein [Oceanicoccus sagamiensis]ARN74236.1 hypothetical protein BST96_08945 [Oceanicoccus sagamiensis]
MTFKKTLLASSIIAAQASIVPVAIAQTTITNTVTAEQSSQPGGLTIGNTGVIDIFSVSGFDVGVRVTTPTGDITNNNIIEIVQDVPNSTSGGDGIYLEGVNYTGTITNNGSIDSDISGIALDNQAVMTGNIINTATGIITGDKAGLGAAAIRIEQRVDPTCDMSCGSELTGGLPNQPVLNGSITNSGVIQANTGNAIDIVVGQVTGGISNSGASGLITSTSGVGINIESGQLSGGINNAPASVIRGSSGIVVSVNNTYFHPSTLDGGINNAGTIEGTLNAAIAIINGGVLNGGISNNAGGNIEGGPVGILADNAQLNGGISNAAGGLIRGDIDGIYMTFSNLTGGIDNSGDIDGDNGIGVLLEDGVTLTGGITNNLGGTIAGLAGVQLVDTTVDSISNAGSIVASGVPSTTESSSTGLSLLSGSTVTGSITNTGSISSSIGTAVLLADSTVNGAINNAAGGSIAGVEGGMTVFQSTVTGGISNSGTISSPGPETGEFVGYGLDVQLSSVGAITNTATGTITGGFILDESAMTGSFTNAGTLQGAMAGGDGYVLRGANSTQGELINSGTITGDGGISVEDGAVFTSAITNSGTISGSDAAIALDNGSGITTLNNTASGIIQGGSFGAIIVLDTLSSITTINNDGTINGQTNFGAGGGSFNNTGTAGDLLGVGAVVNSGTLGNVQFAPGGGSFVSTAGTVGNVTDVIGAVSNAGTVGNVAFGAAGGTFTNTGSAGDIIDADAVINTGAMLGDVNLVTTGGSFSNGSGSVGNVVNVNGDVSNGGGLASLTYMMGGSGTVTNTGTITGNLSGTTAVINSGNLGDVFMAPAGGSFTNNAGTVGNVSNVIGAASNAGTVGNVDFGMAGGSFTNTGSAGDIINANAVTNTGATLGDVTLVMAGGSFSNGPGTVGNVSNVTGDVINDGVLASLSYVDGGAAALDNSGTIGGAITGNTAVINSGTLGDVVLAMAGGSFTNNAGTVGNVSNVAGAASNAGSVGNVGFGATGGTFTNTGSAGDIINANSVINNGGMMGDAVLATAGGSFTNAAGTVGNVSNVAGPANNAGTVGNVSFSSAGGSFNNGGIAGDISGANGVINTGASLGNVTLVATGGNFSNGTGSVGNVSNVTGNVNNDGTLSSLSYIAAGGALTNAGTITGAVTGSTAVTNSGSLGDVTLAAAGGSFSNLGGTAGNISNVSGNAINGGNGVIGNLSFVGGGGSFDNTGTAGNISNATSVFNFGGSIGDIALNNGSYVALRGNSGAVTGASLIRVGIDPQTPGASISTINGDLTFNGSLVVEANGTETGVAQFSQLAVTGDADVRGAGVYIAIQSGFDLFSDGYALNVLTAGGTLLSDVDTATGCDTSEAAADPDCLDDAIGGIDVTDNSSAIEFEVIQRGQILTASIGEINFAPALPPAIERTKGGQNVDRVADSLNTIALKGDPALQGSRLSGVATQLALLPRETTEDEIAYAEALRSLNPDTVEGGSLGAMQADAVAASTVDNRMTSLRGYYGFSGAVAGDPLGVNGFWLQAYDNETDQSVRDAVDGFDASTFGFALGFDAPLSDRIDAGMALSYADTDVDMKLEDRNSMSIDSYRFTTYGSYNGDKYYFDGQFAYAQNDYESVRVVDESLTPGETVIAKGQHDGDQYNFRIRGGLPLAFESGWFVTPKAEMNYTYLREDSYSETGAGNVGLDISTEDVEVLVLGVGFKAAYPYTTANEVTWIPEISIDYMYDTVGDEVEVDSNFVGVTGAAFITNGANVEKESWKFGLKLRTFSQGNFSFAVGYDYVDKTDYESESISGTLRYDF